MSILTTIDSIINYSVTLKLNFDDALAEEKTYAIGDEISLDYIKDKSLVSVHGILKDISGFHNIATILVIDASSEFETNVVNVNVNNIRKLNEIV